MIPDVGAAVGHDVEKHPDAGEVFAEGVLDAVAAYGRRLRIVADGLYAVSVGEIYGPLVMVFLRDQREAFETVHLLGLGDGIEGAGAFVVEEYPVGLYAAGHEGVADGAWLVASVLIQPGVVAAAGDDELYLTGVI